MATQNLIRKQYLMSPEHISKVDRLARQTGTSSTQIVRLAVEAYDPARPEEDSEQSELMSLVSSRLREAIADTRKTRRRLEKTLDRIGDD